jgi:hypothetical protein
MFVLKNSQQDVAEQLVVGLHAHTTNGNFPVISHASQKIIVRASNPGQFESDVELCWQKGQTQVSFFFLEIFSEIFDFRFFCWRTQFFTMVRWVLTPTDPTSRWWFTVISK